MSANSYSGDEINLWKQKRGLEKLQFLLDRLQSVNGTKFPQIISQDGFNFIKSFLISGNFISEGLDLELTGKTVMKAQDNIDFLIVLISVFNKNLRMYTDVERKLRKLYFDTINDKEVYCYNPENTTEKQLTDLLYCLGLADEPGEDRVLCSYDQQRVKIFGIGLSLFKNLFPPTKEKLSQKTINKTQDIDYGEDTNPRRVLQFDYFICHASEDKKTIARGITNYLLGEGKNCWFDEIQFHSSKKTVKSQFKEGVELSQFGIPILSRKFFDKRKKNKQCREELKVMENHIRNENDFKIVPIWFGVNKAYIDQKHTNKKLSTLPSVTKCGVNEVARELLRMTTNSSF